MAGVSGVDFNVLGNLVELVRKLEMNSKEGWILRWAAHVALSVTMEGYKEILSITVGTYEFWLGMSNNLKSAD